MSIFTSKKAQAEYIEKLEQENEILKDDATEAHKQSAYNYKKLTKTQKELDESNAEIANNRGYRESVKKLETAAGQSLEEILKDYEKFLDFGINADAAEKRITKALEREKEIEAENKAAIDEAKEEIKTAKQEVTDIRENKSVAAEGYRAEGEAAGIKAALGVITSVLAPKAEVEDEDDTAKAEQK